MDRVVTGLGLVAFLMVLATWAVSAATRRPPDPAAIEAQREIAAQRAKAAQEEAAFKEARSKWLGRCLGSSMDYLPRKMFRERLKRCDVWATSMMRTSSPEEHARMMELAEAYDASIRVEEAVRTEGP